MADPAPAVVLPEVRIALVLGGGNALGAYHAGLYEALHEAGAEPDWIVGTSVGAINGAVIAGNVREDRLDRLRTLWRPAGEAAGWPMPWDLLPEDWRRTHAVLATLIGGRPGMFGPLGPFGSWWTRDPEAGSPALYDMAMLKETLSDLVDFDRLNGAAGSRPRFTALTVDVESGEELFFDTADRILRPEHIRASAALLTAYPAVEVEGRLLGDGGLSMNLPLDPVMADAGDSPTLCIAVDLLPLAGRRPGTLGEVIERMQDLALAAQTRRTVERWQAIFSARSNGDAALPSITLAMLAYTGQEQEVAGKAMDFSPETIRQRWSAGLDDGRHLLGRIAAGEIALGRPGLNVAAK